MLGRVTVGLIFFLLVWGNLVAGLKAGLACPDWPLCHGKVLPPFRLDIYMEFLHRVIAAVAGTALIALDRDALSGGNQRRRSAAHYADGIERSARRTAWCDPAGHDP